MVVYQATDTLQLAGLGVTGSMEVGTPLKAAGRGEAVTIFK